MESMSLFLPSLRHETFLFRLLRKDISKTHLAIRSLGGVSSPSSSGVSPSAGRGGVSTKSRREPTKYGEALAGLQRQEQMQRQMLSLLRSELSLLDAMDKRSSDPRPSLSRTREAVSQAPKRLLCFKVAH